MLNLLRSILDLHVNHVEYVGAEAQKKYFIVSNVVTSPRGPAALSDVSQEMGSTLRISIFPNSRTLCSSYTRYYNVAFVSSECLLTKNQHIILTNTQKCKIKTRRQIERRSLTQTSIKQLPNHSKLKFIFSIQSQCKLQVDLNFTQRKQQFNYSCR